MNNTNHQFRLAARPVGMPKREDWNYTEEPVREPVDGELLVKVLYISLDPAMRGRMNEGKSYIPPVAPGRPGVAPPRPRPPRHTYTGDEAQAKAARGVKVG